MHTYMHIQAYTNTHTCIHTVHIMHINMHVCAHPYVHVCACIHLYIYTNVQEDIYSVLEATVFMLAPRLIVYSVTRD